MYMFCLIAFCNLELKINAIYMLSCIYEAVCDEATDFAKYRP